MQTVEYVFERPSLLYKLITLKEVCSVLELSSLHLPAFDIDFTSVRNIKAVKLFSQLLRRVDVYFTILSFVLSLKVFISLSRNLTVLLPLLKSKLYATNFHEDSDRKHSHIHFKSFLKVLRFDYFFLLLPNTPRLVSIRNYVVTDFLFVTFIPKSTKVSAEVSVKSKAQTDIFKSILTFMLIQILYSKVVEGILLIFVNKTFNN